MTIEHKYAAPGKLHAISNWRKTSIAERDALVVTADDIGKICWVVGKGHYSLASVTPATWESMSGQDIADAVEAHRIATDPHGDRAYAAAAIATHSSALDPHGDRAYSVQRGNHTGTQLAATISDFATAVGALVPVTSVFGRTGPVVAASGDYSVAQITGAAPLADPTFTGNVGMPTRTQGDNAAYGASTAYVDTAVAAAVVGVLKDRGNHDASGNVFPSTGGSGTAGAIKKGDFWYISVAGTLGGTAVNIGDSIRALVDAPGQTAGNWAQLESNIGYVPFNAANVDTDTTLATNSDTRVPSQKAIKAYSDLPKASVWRIADGTDATKKLALDLSAISTGTTRTLTMPNASVSLGYVPTGFAVSGGIATMTGASGSYTLTFSVYDTNPITTSSGLNLVAGRVYQCSADTSSYTINLPASPADGDWVVIKDTPLNKNSRIGNAGVITVNGGSNTISTSLATTWAMTGSSLYGAARFTYLLVWSTAFASWLVANRSPDQSYLTGGVKLVSSYLGSTKVTQLISQANSANRSVQFPDYDIDFTWYNSLPYRNTAFGTLPSGVNSVILAGSGHKVTKSYQAVLCGISANADGLCPDDSAIYANRSTVYTGSKVTGYIATLKGQSANTANALLATSSNVQGPAYLTKPSGHNAVSVFNLTLSMTTSAGKTWTGVRRVSVRWDGTTATTDTQTVGVDWNPDAQTIVFSASVSSGNITFNLANSSAAGGDTCYWQCTYEAHHNGG